MATITRQNIEQLTDDELAQLRAGYAAMQALSDNRGFNSIAGYHKVPLNLCYHHEPGGELMFLPWHRGYMLTFEQYLRDQNAALTLPYWDWTSPASQSSGVPKAFSDATQADGGANPLLRSYINVPTATPPVTRWTVRFPTSVTDPNLRLPTSAEVQQLLAEPDYATFAQGLQGIHDTVHGWTGGQQGDTPGDMALVDFAAFDPIFYSHHCMIDRIWARWQEINGVNNITPSLLQRPLRGFDNLTVSSVLDISQLGYSYASDEIVVNDQT
jgi:tyrosinase